MLDKLPDELFAPAYDPDHPHALRLGLHGQAAYNFVQTHRLGLTENEVDYLSSIVFNEITHQAQYFFNKDQPVTSFADLPEQARTVLVDLSYNMGPGFGHVKGSAARQALWHDFLSGDYKAAAELIESSFPAIIGSDRARDDARKLREIS